MTLTVVQGNVKSEINHILLSSKSFAPGVKNYIPHLVVNWLPKLNKPVIMLVSNLNIDSSKLASCYPIMKKFLLMRVIDPANYFNVDVTTKVKLKS